MDSKNLGLYTYCHQNPMIMVDPDGNSPLFLAATNPLGAAAIVVLGAVWIFTPVEFKEELINHLADNVKKGNDAFVNMVGGGSPSIMPDPNDFNEDRNTNNGRHKNDLKPDPNAKGEHSTFKVDPKTGKITNTAEWKPNPKNPTRFDEVQRTDIVGESHFSKSLNKKIETPHTHKNNDVTPAELKDIPNQ